ncbi:MAG TPA: FAD-dependent oxidoreductase [Actinomycetota bacterium]
MDVAVVGAGPAGLAAAIELRKASVEVVVLDRESEAGGVPRHCVHQGFGLRDMRRPMTGPAYARRYTRLAESIGAQISTEATVTGWSDDGSLEVTSPRGREIIAAEAIVLATGCRERPRAARLVAGSRPQGVMTTGTLQQVVYGLGERPGRLSLVVGAEHVSYSAVLTLHHAGVRVVGLVTHHPRHQTFASFDLLARLRFGFPVWTRTVLNEIRGSDRVESVELMDLTSGATWSVACDTVVFTGDWIPDHELAVLGGVELDGGTRGPSVDPAGRTSRIGVFAAGNVVHAAETADVAASGGRSTARSVVRFLEERSWPAERTPVALAPPLCWIAPNALTQESTHPAGVFRMRADTFLRGPTILIEQDGRELSRHRPTRMVPGRSLRLPGGWSRSVDPAAGPITVSGLPSGRDVPLPSA